MVIEQFDQESLLSAINKGRTDFTGITIKSEVSLTLNRGVRSLIFDKAYLGPVFRIDSWRNQEADLSMLDSWGQEVYLNSIKIRAFGLTLRGDHCWLQVQNCGGLSLSLADSTFSNGLRIFDSWADILDLSRVQSSQTYLDNADWFGSIIEEEASLGKRTPLTLGEFMAHQNAT